MGYIGYEKLQAFLDDPDDKRHGAARGYQLGCRCDRCREAGREYSRRQKQRRYERYLEKAREGRTQKPAKPKAKAKGRKDICTVPEFLRPLMGKPSLSNAHGRCCWCGRPATNRHHVVKRSAGTWVKDGRTITKPTILLCGEGNASGCHGKAHQGLLHFDWREAERDPVKSDLDPAPYGSGFWVGREFDEPTSQFEAMQVEEGWRRL